MVRISKHRARPAKLQHWQHLANFRAHIEHAKHWLTTSKAELIDAWNSYKTK